MMERSWMLWKRKIKKDINSFKYIYIAFQCISLWGVYIALILGDWGNEKEGDFNLMGIGGGGRGRSRGGCRGCNPPPWDDLQLSKYTTGILQK